MEPANTGTDQIIIYHNGVCSKSGGALELLQAQQVPHVVRWYMNEPLNREELIALLNKLNLPPSALIRKNEELFQEQYGTRNLSESECLDILVHHAELMQRPIVEYGNHAVVARPPERVQEMIELVRGL